VFGVGGGARGGGGSLLLPIPGCRQSLNGGGGNGNELFGR